MQSNDCIFVEQYSTKVQQRNGKSQEKKTGTKDLHL